MSPCSSSSSTAKVAPSSWARAAAPCCRTRESVARIGPGRSRRPRRKRPVPGDDLGGAEGAGPRGHPLHSRAVLRPAAPAVQPGPAPALGDPDPVALLRRGDPDLRPGAPAAQPPSLSNRPDPGPAGPRRDVPGGHRGPRGSSPGALPGRGRQHGRVLQPDGRGARGQPPGDRGLQPQPRGDGRGPHHPAPRVRGEPAHAQEPPLHGDRQRRDRGVLPGRDRPGRGLQRPGQRDPRAPLGGRPRAHPRGGAGRSRGPPGSPRSWPRCATVGPGAARPRSCASCPRAGAPSRWWPPPFSARGTGPSERWWCART